MFIILTQIKFTQVFRNAGISLWKTINLRLRTDRKTVIFWLGFSLLKGDGELPAMGSAISPIVFVHRSQYCITVVVEYGFIGRDYLERKEAGVTLIGFLVLLLIAAIAGALGQALSGYTVGGCLASILIGFIGAFLGLWLARQLGLPEFFTLVVEGEPFPVVWAIIGSAIVSLIFGLLTSRRRYV